MCMSPAARRSRQNTWLIWRAHLILGQHCHQVGVHLSQPICSDNP